MSVEYTIVLHISIVQNRLLIFEEHFVLRVLLYRFVWFIRLPYTIAIDLINQAYRTKSKYNLLPLFSMMSISQKLFSASNFIFFFQNVCFEVWKWFQKSEMIQGFVVENTSCSRFLFLSQQIVVFGEHRCVESKFIFKQIGEFDDYLDRGATALWWTTGFGRWNVIKLLILHGTTVNQKTKPNWMPLRSAYF